VYGKAKGTVATGSDAVLTLATTADGVPAVYTVTFGYATAVSGNLTIVQGATTLLDIDIIDTTAYHWEWPEGLYDPGKIGTAIVVTLLDGSTDKELNVTGRCTGIS
jgi:hypothetical protein